MRVIKVTAHRIISFWRGSARNGPAKWMCKNELAKKGVVFNDEMVRIEYSKSRVADPNTDFGLDLVKKKF
jgi:hypothetical protein